MGLTVTRPRGTADIVPGEAYKWQYIEDTAIKSAHSFGFRETRFPTFEHTELFLRGVGDSTDIVQKEMYTFRDKGERSITLRPEGTSSAVRSAMENSLFSAGLPVKMFYIAPVFRYDKPQAGRLREHHQFGVELFGADDAKADTEVILLASNFLNRLRIENTRIELNSIGCKKCRADYLVPLRAYFQSHIASLCETCNGRLERNPLRILDCKSEKCQEIVRNAPIGLDYLCGDCAAHFDSLKGYLTAAGVKYSVNPRIVRGLDYYTRTVFEIISDGINGLSILSGGRYDDLVSELGGKATPGIGFGCGLERVLLLIDANGIEIPKPKPLDLFIARADPKNAMPVLLLCSELRKLGASVEYDLLDRSLKAQMKYADRCRAKYCLVIGEDELRSGIGMLKPMSGDSGPITVPLNCDKIINVLNDSAMHV